MTLLADLIWMRYTLFVEKLLQICFTRVEIRYIQITENFILCKLWNESKIAKDKLICPERYMMISNRDILNRLLYVAI